MAIPVFRTSDKTGPSMYGKEITENAHIGLRKFARNDQVVNIAFSTEQSSFSVLIYPDSFKDLAALMMKANANETIKAFGAAKQAGLDQQPPASN
jgi:hypothetical protein